jgi:hypothetical protein
MWRKEIGEPRAENSQGPATIELVAPIAIGGHRPRLQAELGQIMRQRAFPFVLAGYSKLAAVQRMSRQEQLLLQTRRPAERDELEIQLFVRPVNLVTDNRMTKRS